MRAQTPQESVYLLALQIHCMLSAPGLDAMSKLMPLTPTTDANITNIKQQQTPQSS